MQDFAPTQAKVRDLDPLDVAILVALQRNGRMSNKSLAAHVGLSPSACLARVRALEREGRIRAYAALLGRPTLDLHFEGWAMVTLRERTPAALAKLQALISDMENIVEAYEVATTFDALLHVVAADEDDWRQVEAEIMTALGEHAGVRIGLFMSELKAPSPWPVASARSLASETKEGWR